MTNTVTMPDGSIHNFPDEATPEMMAQALGVSVGQPEQGFTQRVSNDYRQRVSNAQDLANRGVDSNSMLGVTPLKAVEMGTQLVAGPIADVGKEAMKSFYDSTATPSVKSGMNQIGNFISPAVNAASDAYHKLPQDVQDFGNMVGTGANAVGFAMPAAKLADATGSAVGSVASAAKDAVTGGAIPTSEQVLNEGSKAYQAAYAAGAGTDATATNNMLTQANKAAFQDPILNQVAGDDSVTKYLKGLNTIQDQPLTLQNAHALDQQLADKISVATRTGENDTARRFGMVQDALRENLMNPDPAHITGGAEGYQAWTEGNRLWSMGKKMESVEAIQKNAVGADVPATAIKNGAKALLKNVNKSGGMGWTEDQLAALKEASQTGIITGLMKNLGSKLIGPVAGSVVGGAVGGPLAATAGAGAAYIAGAPFRAGATALQAGRVNNVLRALADDPKFNAPKGASSAPPPRAAGGGGKASSNVVNRSIAAASLTNPLQMLAKKPRSP